MPDHFVPRKFSALYAALAHRKTDDGGKQNRGIYRRIPKADIFLGRVKARDEQMAIPLAVERLAVTDRYHQRGLERLVREAAPAPIAVKPTKALRKKKGA